VTTNNDFSWKFNPVKLASCTEFVEKQGWCKKEEVLGLPQFYLKRYKIDFILMSVCKKEITVLNLNQKLIKKLF
jgi:hypothetical protein